jgi:hypothetical protein
VQVFLVQKSGLNKKWPLGAIFGARPPEYRKAVLHQKCNFPSKAVFGIIELPKTALSAISTLQPSACAFSHQQD